MGAMKLEQDTDVCPDQALSKEKQASIAWQEVASKQAGKQTSFVCNRSWASGCHGNMENT